jgi:hypothetical protein
MADLPPDSNGETGEDAGPGQESATGTPRWVKVFGIIAVVLVLLVGVMLVTGGGPGGGHGPGRHIGGDDTPAGDRGRQTPPASVPEQPEVHTGPPPGVEHGPQEP